MHTAPTATGGFLAACLALCLPACGDGGDGPGPTKVLTPAGGDAGGERFDGGVPTYVRPNSPRWPQTDGSLELPFGAEATYEFEVQAAVGRMDVHISMDSSASFRGEIDALRRQLRGTLVPELDARVADVAFGVSRFEDFPVGPHGTMAVGDIRGDRPFELLSEITTRRSRTVGAVDDLAESLGRGGDVPEAGAEALWQIATGEGYAHAGVQYIEPFEPAADAEGRVGGVGFRDDALPVVLHITDAPAHESYPGLPGTHTLAEAAKALTDIGARVVAIYSGGAGGSARAELERLAHATGAIAEASDEACPHGLDGEDVPTYEGVCPLVFDADPHGDGLSDRLVEAIATLLDSVAFAAVHGVAATDPLGFVERIDALGGDPDGPGLRIEDRLPEDAPDGHPDTLINPRRDEPMRFRVHLRNGGIRPASSPQRFRVAIEVVAGPVLLSRLELQIVVPAADPDADAGI